MSDNSRTFELSRRKVLTGLGGVGLASAGAGLGTSAYLNDTESFENNTIAAGQLDLKVDWEEHYSYPQLYGIEDPTSGLDYGVHRSEPDEPEAGEFVGFPDHENPQVWIHEDDLAAYMANTSIEAFPDPDNDGAQEVEYEGWTYVPCDHGADLDEHLTPSEDNATRTDAEYMEDGESLINLQDVKPGDFGELTLSFHLCDNPGYVWLQAMNFTESGGTTTGPEPTPDNGELAENIQTVWWYDDGDNVLERGDCGDTLYLTDYTNGTNDDAVLYSLDISGGGASTTELGDISGGDYDFDRAHVGASPDGDTVYIVPSDIEDDDPSAGMATYDTSQTPGSGTFSFKDIDLNGHGALGDAVQVAVDNDGVLYIVSMDNNTLFEIADPDAGTPTVTDSMALDINIAGADCAFTSNSEFYIFTNDDQTLHAVNLLSGNTSEVATLDTGEYLTGLAVNDSGNGEFIGSSRTNSDLVFFDDDGNVVERRDLTGLSGHQSGDLTTGELCEEEIFSGTLDEAMDEFAADDGDGFMLNDGDCYQPGFTRYVGFAWWVPTDVGNEIQADEVSFDFGFYTEQCRNNDDPSDDDGNGDTGTDQSVTLEGFESDGYIDGELTVGDGDDGDSLNDIVFDFPDPGSVGISNVGSGDVDVRLNGTNIDSDLNSADGSDNGTTLTLGFGGSNSLSAGDTIEVDLNDVQFSNDADVSVDVTVNGDGPTTTTMAVN